MSLDVLITVTNSMSLNNNYVNMEMLKCDSCENCLNLDAELSKSKQAYNDLLKIHSQLEQQKYFEINDLKAWLHDKDKTICKLKDTIKSLRENTKEENVNHDKWEIEPINKELENSVAKLLYENERLCNEINHVKQDLKAQIQDKVFVITSLKNDLRKLKGKEIVENVVHIPSANTIAPGMFKLDLEPLPPRPCFKYTQESQELAVLCSKDTCPNAITPKSRKVAVTPMNNVKKVRFAEPLTSSSKRKQAIKGMIGSRRHPVGTRRKKVEAQPRKVNKMNRVVKPACDVDVKHSLSKTNSEILCATCNKSMFDGVHDKCLLDLVQNGNKRTKSAKKHKKQNVWKPTGHVFTEVGFKWKPTRRTFTIVGSLCFANPFLVGGAVLTGTTHHHSSSLPIAPVTAMPGIRRRSAILIRPGEAIPFGRPYRTHLNGPRKLLTARNRVGPLPARRLASRHVSPRSSDHHSSSSSSSSDSSPVHSLGLDASVQAHSGSSTRDVLPRLCYPLRRAPQRSEAFRHWCAAPLSTLYPPTTSESSSGDSSERPLHSSLHSAGPSRKRCRSLVDVVPSSTPVMGSLSPTCANFLPPCKRFRDSYSSEVSTRMSAPTVEEEIVEQAREDPSDSSGTMDGIVRSFEDMPIDLDDVVRDFYHHMSEVRIDRIVRIRLS
ncbi:hypothetical protein Tco_0336824 [Tanacetum coccineum]